MFITCNRYEYYVIKCNVISYLNYIIVNMTLIREYLYR